MTSSGRPTEYWLLPATLYPFPSFSISPLHNPSLPRSSFSQCYQTSIHSCGRQILDSVRPKPRQRTPANKTQPLQRTLHSAISSPPLLRHPHDKERQYEYHALKPQVRNGGFKLALHLHECGFRLRISAGAADHDKCFHAGFLGSPG